MPNTIYTVRFGYILPDKLLPDPALSIHKAELKNAGFVATQFPTPLYVPTTIRIAKDTPAKGFTTAYIHAPPFEDTELVKHDSAEEDFVPVVESRRGQVSTFAWNLIAPSSPAPGADPMGTLRSIFRTPRILGAVKLGLIVSEWSKTPFSLPGYPDRPPAPEPGPAKGGAGVGAGLCALLGLLGLLWAVNEGD
jgi:hypothetical protein